MRKFSVAQKRVGELKALTVYHDNSSKSYKEAFDASWFLEYIAIEELQNRWYPLVFSREALISE